MFSDADECSNNDHSCDVNAVCSNTVGSYACACKAGYTGDGRNCTDIDVDECTSGLHSCHSFASCTNTIGSYRCSCQQYFNGDGKNCQHSASECQNYASLNSGDRKITFTNYRYHCDSGIGPGWFRFEGSAGTRMPTSCPPYHRCGTYVTGWLNGGHPTVADGQVSRQVCFHYTSSCCDWSKNIKVRNCGSYYVYFLSGTPGCNLRYCSTN
ncbi:PREDICTED: uromodulin-like isoform X1 [Acropora digitifera]|uniref:uromodulin-like isoform X1 n=1 Tax=Acropora digitifera TaxID=70779 RepID=UPI00077A38F1|nr:PREDICTED: uromodulin-like isoform X1 [Acropora digitifera]